MNDERDDKLDKILGPVNPTGAETYEEKRVRQKNERDNRMSRYGDWKDQEWSGEVVDGGHVPPPRRTPLIPEKKSFFSTSNKWNWALGILVGFIISGWGLSNLESLGVGPLPRLIIALIGWAAVACGVKEILDRIERLRHAEEYNEVLRRVAADLQEENRELKKTSLKSATEDFISGMNTAGVEVLLGGAGPGEPSYSMKLRFPVIKLHEQLVEALMQGWEKGKREADGLISDLHRHQFKKQAEQVAWNWISAMTEGKR